MRIAGLLYGLSNVITILGFPVLEQLLAKMRIAVKTQPIKPKKPGHDPSFLVTVFRARGSLAPAKKSLAQTYEPRGC